MALPAFILPPHLAGNGWVELLRDAGMEVQLAEAFEGSAKDHYGYIIVQGASTIRCMHIPNWPVSTAPGAAKADHLVIMPQQSLARDKLFETLKDVLLAAGAVMK